MNNAVFSAAHQLVLINGFGYTSKNNCSESNGFYFILLCNVVNFCQGQMSIFFQTN